MRTWSLISTFALVLLLSCGGQKKNGDTHDKARNEAPKHDAPDQDRIDSLKREKQKEREE